MAIYLELNILGKVKQVDINMQEDRQDIARKIKDFTTKLGIFCRYMYKFYLLLTIVPQFFLEIPTAILDNFHLH